MAPTDDGQNGAARITVWVVVPVAVHAAAERLASAYAQDGAEEVCAAVLHGLAEAEAGAGTLDARLLGGWLACHPWPRSGAEGKR